MGDIPHPPKLKLTPRNRAFLAGELYPPDEPYDQPHVEERNKRNLKGVADARATLNATKPYEEGTQGQWFYDVKPSPVGYFKAGTHGQVYSNYAPAAPGVSTPKKAGPPPPGATSARPVDDKPPTLSSRSYFASGTQGQPMPRDRSKRDRTGEAEKRRNRNRHPRTDKTTPFDTMTREELMRHREEEVQRMRAEK